MAGLTLAHSGSSCTSPYLHSLLWDPLHTLHIHLLLHSQWHAHPSSCTLSSLLHTHSPLFAQSSSMLTRLYAHTPLHTWFLLSHACNCMYTSPCIVTPLAHVPLPYTVSCTLGAMLPCMFRSLLSTHIIACTLPLVPPPLLHTSILHTLLMADTPCTPSFLLHTQSHAVPFASPPPLAHLLLLHPAL